ncbi:hypothetical protein F2P45_34130 [Massilia sp. CCM 8733]|uniref:Uncharacterized protein n=1 Tax=Massilia mucilaginosa TaxID=2609282 RepID=A0ABX0P3U5_9BURK|nr:hypothetical protein [Massilia mucilaginosa]
MSADQKVVLTAEEWRSKLVQASMLSAKEIQCPMCGGTGGWPGLLEFVWCRACNRTGINPCYTLA